MNLILYNYCKSAIADKELYKDVKCLLASLRNQDVPVQSIRLVLGAEEYSATHNLIGKVIEFWYNRPKQDRLHNIHKSFYLLEQYCKGNEIDPGDLAFGSRPVSTQIAKDLIAMMTTPIPWDSFFDSVLITGDKYELEHPYGDAIPPDSYVGGICFNRCLEWKSIWHETAHLLGAEEHYERSSPTKDTREICTNPQSCLMRWNSLEGMVFCSQSIEEMKKFLNNRAS